MSHLCLIDGTSMIRRAWSVADKEKDASGQVIGTAVLFSKMIVKLMRRMEQGNIPPTHMAILFDPPREDTWRRALYADYKAHRPPYEPEYLSQIPIIREMCDRIGLANACCENHEADDLIAAMTEDAFAAGTRVSIVSSDKDLMQLVRKGVLHYNPASEKWHTAAKVEEKFGVPVAMLGDYLALMGDAGDGVPGGKGIGPKMAAEILNETGSLDAALANPALVSRAVARKSVETNGDMIRLSRKLVSFDIDACPRLVPIETATAPSAVHASGILHDYVRDRRTAPDAENDIIF